MKIKDGEYRYGMWTGNPRGTPEDKTLCVSDVHDPDCRPAFHQCSRKRGHGPNGEYCKQHAAMHTERQAWLHGLDIAARTYGQ